MTTIASFEIRLPVGKRLDVSPVNLSGADLRDQDLTGLRLSGAHRAGNHLAARAAAQAGKETS